MLLALAFARASVCALVCASVCAGCAENAIFTLVLDVPAPVGDRDKVVVEARTGEESFLTDWQQTQISGITLVGPERNEVRASLEADGDKITQPVRIKVRFCMEERCTSVLDGNAPELDLIVARAFYQGRYTEYRYEVDTLPPETVPLEVTIGKCDVAAPECIDGSPTSWCVGDVHYCE
jgi:hypothetical protein